MESNYFKAISANAVTCNGKITVIGPAIIDVLARPVDFSNIQLGSLPLDDIIISYGGDALNQSIVLKRLGAKVEIISKLGQDVAGDKIVEMLTDEGVICKGITRDNSLSTSINIVLIDHTGERYFLTNPSGSMRKLTEQDITANIDSNSDIISFAGMFVSPMLDIHSMARVFEHIKSTLGKPLAVDMTKAKNNERLSDLQPLLMYVDYIFPNESEISLLTGEENARISAKMLVDSGVKCAVIKRGSNGCLICTKDKLIDLPAYTVNKVIDSTGAGDSFVAGFLFGLQQGFDLEHCGMFANAVASCIVEKIGATNGIQSPTIAYSRYQELIEREQL